VTKFGIGTKYIFSNKESGYWFIAEVIEITTDEGFLLVKGSFGLHYIKISRYKTAKLMPLVEALL
jgi:hypothetical protein